MLYGWERGRYLLITFSYSHYCERARCVCVYVRVSKRGCVVLCVGVSGPECVVLRRALCVPVDVYVCTVCRVCVYGVYCQCISHNQAQRGRRGLPLWHGVSVLGLNTGWHAVWETTHTRTQTRAHPLILTHALTHQLTHSPHCTP